MEGSDDSGESTDSSSDYPNPGIAEVNPASEDGQTGSINRAAQSHMEEELGVSLVGEFRGGAGGQLGLSHVWNQDPDGYTLAFNPLGTTVLDAALEDIEYDPLEFSYASGLARKPLSWYVPTDGRLESWQDFIDTALNESVTVGTVGSSGSVTHFEMMLAVDAYDIPQENINVVPYDGGSGVSRGVASGEVDIGITSSTSAQSFAEDGQLKPVLMSRADPSPIFPDAPLIVDLDRDVPYLGLDGLVFGPPDTPDDIITTIEEAALAAVETEEFTQWAEDGGYSILGWDSEQTLQEIEAGMENAELYAELLNEN
jgi:tripartite-type tricarboxylate transporter receptor subunit TctC